MPPIRKAPDQGSVRKGDATQIGPITPAAARYNRDPKLSTGN